MRTPPAVRTDTPLHILGCSAFILRGGKALVLQRAATERFLPGYWELPGGKVEHGEHPYDAVVREVREETGLTVRALHPFTLFHDLLPDGRHYVDITVLCALEGIRTTPSLTPADHQAYRWASGREIRQLAPMSDSVRDAISAGFRGARREP